METNVQSKPLEYKEYLVAHIDILGTSNLLENREESLGFLNKLNKMYLLARDAFASLNDSLHKDNDENFDLSDFNIKTKIFSDNICIFLEYPKRENQFFSVCFFLQMVAYYQFYSLLEYGFFVRGGIEIGNFYENDVFIVGESLLNAYKLENKKALSPRILLGKSLLEKFPPILGENRETLLGFSKKDTDGEFFVDYLVYSRQKDKNQKDILTKHREILIDKFLNSNDYTHQQKILSAMLYHNRYCIKTNEVADEMFVKYIDGLHDIKNCVIDIQQLIFEKTKIR